MQPCFCEAHLTTLQISVWLLANAVSLSTISKWFYIPNDEGGERRLIFSRNLEPALPSLRRRRRMGGMKPSLMVTHAEHTAHSDIWPLHLTHLSTRSLVLGEVGVRGEGGCPMPCSRAPRQGRRWTGTSPSSSPHSIFRSGRGFEPATLQLTVQAPTDWATAGQTIYMHTNLCNKKEIL